MPMVAGYHFMAELVGTFVPFERGEGAVVSVHSNAVNIRRPGGLLLSIVERPTQMTSLSLCAPALFQTLRRQRPSILPGELVKLRRGSLLLDRLCLDVKTGKAWKGAIHAKLLRGFPLDSLSAIKEALLEVGRKEGLLGLIAAQRDLNPFALFASDRLKGIPPSENPPPKAVGRVKGSIPFEGRGKPRFKGLSSLIGLGPGFTPSGDDFIMGVLAGETISRTLGRNFLEIDRRDLRTSLHKTNDAGRTLLWQALQGHFPCYLMEAVEGLVKARGFHAIGKVMSCAVAHGETSGTDALAGLVWYLERFKPSCTLPVQIPG